MKASVHAIAAFESDAEKTPLSDYLAIIKKVERLHRLILDVIKDEFERIGVFEINPVQGLLLYNVGRLELSAGELRTRGHYQGSNVSYNLRKLVELGYMDQRKSKVDRRSVRVNLTEKGFQIDAIISELFERHHLEITDNFNSKEINFPLVNGALRTLEKYWKSRIRYIY